MNKVKYSNGTRIIAFILLEILVISASVSAIFLGTANISPAYFKEAMEGKSYIESQYFKDQLMSNLSDVSYYLEAKNDFETDGVYDGSKLINIKQFLNDGSDVSEYSSTQLYRLQDLVNWSQAGTEETTIYQALLDMKSRTVTDHKIVYADSSEDSVSITDAELMPDSSAASSSVYVTPAESVDEEGAVVDGYALAIPNEIYGMIQDPDAPITEDIKDISIIKEGYTTAKDVTFMEVALYDWDIAKIQKTSAEIQQSLVNISDEYNFYKANETYYRSLDSTNFKIYIQDQNGNAILNNCVDSSTDYKDYFKNSVGGGIIYNASNNEFTFTDNINDNVYTNSGKFQVPNETNYIFAVGIDKSLAHTDEFSRDNAAYNNARTSIIVLIASVFAGLVLFIYLVAVSGRSAKDEVIHLNGFDKIQTEIGAGIMVALGIGGILLTEMSINISRTYYELVAGAALEAALFTLGFLSLVKRIKAGQIWKNSLFYLVIKWVVMIFKHRKVTTKVAILYAGFSFITLMLLGIAVGSGSFFVMFLWFVFAAGVGIWLLMDAVERQHILDGIDKITGGELEYKINSDKLKGSNKILAEAINNIGEGLHNAVDASVRNERLKTDLITNVSHDIKTPLTSIINYVDLLKRENIDNEKVNGYIDILDQKSQRLKNLTEDLVEASKISSGNIKLEINKINFVELINQTEGEFSEKFEAKGLQVIKTLPNESVIIEADGRRIWRVIENLYNNVAKYAMPNTRVYVDLKVNGEKVNFSIKNISEHPLNINADELTERFIRGDVSRSTEGSGLGLSIAKNLTTLQNGTFEIYLDGDLFRVTITFPKVDYIIV